MVDEASSLLDEIKQETDFFRKATQLDHLKNAKNMRIKDLSASLAMKPAYLCHILRLNKLPDLIKDGYYSKLVSISHLFIIARLHTQEDMLAVYEKVLEKSLTALQTEELVREVLYSVAKGGEHIPAYELAQNTNRIRQQHEEVHIKVTQTRVKGKIVIEIKGGLQKSTPIIRSIIQKLES